MARAIRRFSGIFPPRAWPRCRPFCAGGHAGSRPLLQSPGPDEGGAIHLNVDCGLDLGARSVPTISIVGPSRRGKSVLAGLLAGGDPALFPQSHSSFIAMTSGTHACEVSLGGRPVRVVDTEGLSHIGRSRKSESLVRQFLISTYLTSSWVVWLDTDVLSSGFFNMMWLVHDYVADVLRIRDSAGTRLPRLMYIRTQETELQSREWRGTYSDFGQFFEAALETHEDAFILTQMFAKGGVLGRALPVWTEHDLDRFSAGEFWRDDHSSQFKSAVASLRDVLMAAEDGDEDQPLGQPPLLALGELERHLPKIAKLEAFDPRDHEAMKVIKARDYLRSAYGRLFAQAGEPSAGGGVSADPVGLANLFEPDDRDVQSNGYRLDRVVRARLERKCDEMRVEVSTALADAEVREVLAHFDDKVSVVFSAGVEAFVAGGGFSEASILRVAIEDAGLDADRASALLAAKRQSAEKRFQEATGLSCKQMRGLRLHEQMVWRIDDCVMRLRRVGRAQLQLEDPDGESAPGPETVWRLGEWELRPPPKDGKTVRARRPKACALWTDGRAWALYEEHPSKDLGKFFDRGELQGASPVLPIP